MLIDFCLFSPPFSRLQWYSKVSKANRKNRPCNVCCQCARTNLVTIFGITYNTALTSYYRLDVVILLITYYNLVIEVFLNYV